MLNLKLAFRTLFKTPFVTIVAIVSLALGIGANAAIFSLFNQMLLRPLPVQEPARLVNLRRRARSPARSLQPGRRLRRGLQLPDVPGPASGCRRRSPASPRTGSFGANLAIAGQTLNGEGMLVSGSYFPVLGIAAGARPAARPDDDRAIGESPVVVLSHAYWQTRFGADPDVLEQDADRQRPDADDRRRRAARLRRARRSASKPQVFVPITMRGHDAAGLRRLRQPPQLLGLPLRAPEARRLASSRRATAINVPYRAILNDVEAPLQQGMSEQTMARFKAKPIDVEDGRRGPELGARRGAGAAAAAARRHRARAAHRVREHRQPAARARGGARRRDGGAPVARREPRGSCRGSCSPSRACWRCFGGVAGIVVAHWTLDLIASLLPAEAATTMSARRSTRACCCLPAALTIGTGLLFGLFPALHSTRPDLVSTLKGQAGQPSGARRRARFRTTLATAQIALSMALLVCGRPLHQEPAERQPRRSRHRRPTTWSRSRISPELNGYTPERSRQLFERLEDELARAARRHRRHARRLVPLLAGSNWGNDVAVEGFRRARTPTATRATTRSAPATSRTLGVPLLAGREFTRADVLGAPKVAIVNEAFAKKFNLGRDAVGKRMGNGRGDRGPLDIEIVGLVQNAKYSEVKREIPPLFFRPYRQDEQLGS